MQSIKDVDWESLQKNAFHPSPAAWEDQTIYFLLVDRFSDGKENDYRDNAGAIVTNGTTPRFRAEQDAESAVATPERKAIW